MNWGDDSAVTCQSERGKPASGPDPLRRKVMSALASVIDKHRRVLEEHDQVVITIYLDWKRGRVRENVMAFPESRQSL